MDGRALGGGADACAGRRIRAWCDIPNDKVLRYGECDDTIWFSDPPYGIEAHHEGYRTPLEVGASDIHRIDPAQGSLGERRLVARSPNGFFDEIHSDANGRISVSDADAVRVFASGGRHIRTIPVEEIVSDLRLAGRSGTAFYVIAQTSLYANSVDAHGDGARLNQWPSRGRFPERTLFVNDNK